MTIILHVHDHHMHANFYLLSTDEEHLNIKNYDGCSQLHQPCVFKNLGCNFEGTTYQLDRHEHDERHYHYHLINSTCKLSELPLLYVY